MDVINKFSIICDILLKYSPIVIILVIYLNIKDVIKKNRLKISSLKIGNVAKSDGIVFGKYKNKMVYSLTDDEGHVIIMGRTGLGKTTALLIPTLRKWRGTSFVIDISGDICKNVEMNNKLIYEPANPDSIPYNIFYTIDKIKDEDDKNEALEQLAMMILPDEIDATSTAQFFIREGRNILTAALIAFYHAGFDFVEICEMVVCNSWKTLFNKIDDIGYAKATRYINSFEKTSEQNTAGSKQCCDGALKLFATNERVKRTIRRPKKNEPYFAPNKLEKNNVFVVLDDCKLKLYSPLLHIMTAQSLEFFSNRSNDAKTTILFCLDEFASFGKLDIAYALRKYRKKHIRIMILTQSIADFDLIYGRDERIAMMDNFSYKVVLGAEDITTQEYFARLTGKVDAKQHSISKNANQTTYTESEIEEWAIKPEEFARLGDKLVLLHPDGYMKLEKNFYYK